MHIDSYSFGSITVDGKVYEADLIIFPDRIKTNWWRRKGHSLAREDLDEVIVYKPEVLVVGRGASGCMDIPASTRRLLEEERIELIDRNTDEACQLFNEQIKKAKRAAGAFHLTC